MKALASRGMCTFIKLGVIKKLLKYRRKYNNVEDISRVKVKIEVITLQ